MKLSIKLKRKALHKALDTYLDAADGVADATRFEVNDAISNFQEKEKKLIALFAEYEGVKE